MITSSVKLSIEFLRLEFFFVASFDKNEMQNISSHVTFLCLGYHSKKNVCRKDLCNAH